MTRLDACSCLPVHGRRSDTHGTCAPAGCRQTRAVAAGMRRASGRGHLALTHELPDIRHLALLDAAHQLAHLVELLDELVDLLNRRARALGDPQPARALDQLRVPALVG